MTSTRQERRKQRTTDLILDAAEGCFNRAGYAATTIDAIAAAADVAVGSIYNRFAGKEELYLALVERLMALNEAYMTEALTSSAAPRRRVLACSEAYLDFHRDHPVAFRLIGLRDLEPASAQRHVQARRRIARRLDGMLDELAGAIQAAVDAGEIHPTDARATATFLWGAWNGVIALHLRGLISNRSMHAAVRAGMDAVDRGLEPAATTSQRRQRRHGATSEARGES